MGLTDLPALPPGQFRLLPGEWGGAGLAIGRHLLQADAALRVTAFTDAAGRVVGALLGDAFRVEDGAAVDTADLAAAFATAPLEAAVEGFFQAVFGSWALVLVRGGQARLYLDPAGSRSAVFSPGMGCAGSSAAALLGPVAEAACFRAGLHATLDVPREGWFPAGLTAHAGLSRLLCNHCLDLGTWRAVRHWPLAEPRREASVEALGDAIHARVAQHIRLLRRAFPCAMAITGGHDTRLLLSALDPGPPLRAFQITWGMSFDLAIARRLAPLAPVVFEEVPARLSTPSEEAAFHHRVGRAMGGGNARYYRSLAALEGVGALIEGVGGEIARGFLWRRGDTPGMALDAAGLHARLGLPPAPEVTAAIAGWLAGLPPMDALHALDLAYLELRVSPWHFAQAYVDAPLRHFSPMLSRPIIEAMLRLPVAARRGDGFPRWLVARHAPALAAIPHNRYGDARDWLVLARKLLQPHRVMKAYRKRLARR